MGSLLGRDIDGLLVRPLGPYSLYWRAPVGPVLLEGRFCRTSVSEDRALPNRREPGLWEIVAHILSTRVRLLLTVPLCGTCSI